MSKNKKHPRGALLPPNMKWMAGKTAASIGFVNQALSVLDSVSQQDRATLLQAIEDIKAGKLVLNQWLSVSQFLGKISF